jgi:hypothetical protein
VKATKTPTWIPHEKDTQRTLFLRALGKLHQDTWFVDHLMKGAMNPRKQQMGQSGFVRFGYLTRRRSEKSGGASRTV